MGITKYERPYDHLESKDELGCVVFQLSNISALDIDGVRSHGAERYMVMRMRMRNINVMS